MAGAEFGHTTVQFFDAMKVAAGITIFKVDTKRGRCCSTVHTSDLTRKNVTMEAIIVAFSILTFFFDIVFDLLSIVSTDILSYIF